MGLSTLDSGWEARSTVLANKFGVMALVTLEIGNTTKLLATVNFGM